MKIAVPKFSKYIIRETTTILAKKSCKGVLVSKRLTTGSLVGNACRNSYKIVTEISEENSEFLDKFRISTLQTVHCKTFTCVKHPSMVD